MYIKLEKLNSLSDEEIKELRTRLLKGDLIIYPTDTVYGLGTIIGNKKSLENIYKVKTRKFSSPLIALVSSVDKIDRIAYLDSTKKEMLNKLAEKFWPGALTVILKKKEIVPEIMVSNGDTVGVRIPNLSLALDIIDLAGGILATTSANISGEESPKSYIELSSKIKKEVNILVDGGECLIGEASTIIDLTKSKPKILRKGAIKKEEIEKIIGEVEV